MSLLDSNSDNGANNNSNNAWNVVNVSSGLPPMITGVTTDLSDIFTDVSSGTSRGSSMRGSSMAGSYVGGSSRGRSQLNVTANGSNRFVSDQTFQTHYPNNQPHHMNNQPHGYTNPYAHFIDPISDDAINAGLTVEIEAKPEPEMSDDDSSNGYSTISSTENSKIVYRPLQLSSATSDNVVIGYPRRKDMSGNVASLMKGTEDARTTTMTMSAATTTTTTMPLTPTSAQVIQTNPMAAPSSTGALPVVMQPPKVFSLVAPDGSSYYVIAPQPIAHTGQNSAPQIITLPAPGQTISTATPHMISFPGQTNSIPAHQNISVSGPTSSPQILTLTAPGQSYLIPGQTTSTTAPQTIVMPNESTATPQAVAAPGQTISAPPEVTFFNHAASTTAPPIDASFHEAVPSNVSNPNQTSTASAKDCYLATWTPVSVSNPNLSSILRENTDAEFTSTSSSSSSSSSTSPSSSLIINGVSNNKLQLTYVCELCDYTSDRKYNIKSHQVTLHIWQTIFSIIWIYKYWFL